MNILKTNKTNKMENIIKTNEKHTCVTVSEFTNIETMCFFGFYSIESARTLRSLFTIGAWKVKSLKN